MFISKVLYPPPTIMAHGKEPFELAQILLLKSVKSLSPFEQLLGPVWTDGGRRGSGGEGSRVE